MDSNDLEREKGIPSSQEHLCPHEGVTINIIDTPGHADLAARSERVLNMADGCCCWSTRRRTDASDAVCPA